MRTHTDNHAEPLFAHLAGIARYREVIAPDTAGIFHSSFIHLYAQNGDVPLL
jgi:hypothetical protein